MSQRDHIEHREVANWQPIGPLTFLKFFVTFGDCSIITGESCAPMTTPTRRASERANPCKLRSSPPIPSLARRVNMSMLAASCATSTQPIPVTML